MLSASLFRISQFFIPLSNCENIFYQANVASKQEEGLVKQIHDVVKGSIMHQWIQFIEQRASVLD